MVCREAHGQREPVIGEPLNEVGAVALGKPIDSYLRGFGQTPWVPVFYRRRSLRTDATDVSTDLVVFGRARLRVDGTIDGMLWAILRDGSVIACPSHAIDNGAIQGLLDNYTEAVKEG